MIRAIVENIVTSDDVSYYKFKIINCDVCLYMLSLSRILGVDESDSVWLNFKSSDVIIANEPLKNCSIKNELKCEILGLVKGEILSIIHLKFNDYEFESIITTSSCEQLNLRVGDSIFAYIKSTSLYISCKND
ncbi:TOBE domain-containing protein [Campylobacter sp. faydin G-140]|uniref:TOBE domain-containing protein n=1 Tax=Campylobacter anatolicus TaxID=2829105 RepID=UPI001B9DD431|nr:TOBE domain-containing protein [Campylobacter anatolicus]MBR8465402.1 TOBE domain-containing protein [Campylobacter anatolicus]